MSRLIGILFVLIAVFVGWKVYQNYDQVKNEEQVVRKAAPAPIIRGDQLEGMPPGLSASFQAAEQQGLAGLRSWLKTYGSQVQDPRKAWIELDCAVLIVRDNPNEAGRIFAAVKARTPPGSPLQPRIKQLEATFGGK